MRRVLLSASLLLAVGAFVVIATGASKNSAVGTYRIELDNAFGLVSGADFKVAGVPAGKIESIDLCGSDKQAHCQNPLHAVVKVSLTQAGFGQFHADAFCQSRPQSLIGEYFVECQPGTKGQVLKPGSTIPVTNTQSTIPGDLVQDVMRLPYRQRFAILINELGAAAAGRSGDLQEALRRAVPALTQTDNLLNLLANDSHTLQQLTVNSDTVITALANNTANVRRFIVQANRISADTAVQQANLRGTFQRLPGFLAQLKPSMAQLGAAADANDPALANLNAASGQLRRLFTDLAPFARASIPALRALGNASVTGRQAVSAATPTIADLNRFARPTPELAKNLAIVLHDLDDRSRAVEPDSRSPTGKGFTGLEALLQYAFNQPLAINSFGQFGHELTVDAFIDPACAPYATPQSVAQNLATDPNYRRCYAWLGPNQPGVNETDPSNPSACVPDPGGAPPGHRGPQTTACKLAPGPSPAARTRQAASAPPNPSSNTADSQPAASGGASQQGAGGGGQSTGSPLNLGGTLGRIVGVLNSASGAGAPAAATAGSGSGASGGSGAGKQTQQLLNYLLAP